MHAITCCLRIIQTHALLHNPRTKNHYLMNIYRNCTVVALADVLTPFSNTSAYIARLVSYEFVTANKNKQSVLAAHIYLQQLC